MKASLTLVLGVHRSGTSLLTNALLATGASAGEFNDTRDADNPDGYAEHPAVREFNDRLLAHLGASWDNWGFRASTIDFDADSLAPWREEASGILQAAFPGYGPFVLKDPRISTLLPFWERVVPAAGFQLRRILILRDPAEVAESQRQRVERRLHDFPVIAGSESMAALWAVTMYEVLASVADDAMLLVSYADIIANPGPTLASAAAFSGIEADSDRIADFASHGVKASLYRSRAGSFASAGGVWMTAARGLYDDLARSGTPRIIPVAEARLTVDRQHGLVPLMPGLSAVRESIARTRIAQVERQSQVAALEQFIWAIAPLAVRSAESHGETAVARATAVVEDTDLAHASFAVAHTLAQLLMFYGKISETEAWLESVREQFGETEAFLNLEKACLRRSAALDSSST